MARRKKSKRFGKKAYHKRYMALLRSFAKAQKRHTRRQRANPGIPHWSGAPITLCRAARIARTAGVKLPRVGHIRTLPGGAELIRYGRNEFRMQGGR